MTRLMARSSPNASTYQEWPERLFRKGGKGVNLVDLCISAGLGKCADAEIRSQGQLTGNASSQVYVALGMARGTPELLVPGGHTSDPTAIQTEVPIAFLKLGMKPGWIWTCAVSACQREWNAWSVAQRMDALELLRICLRYRADPNAKVEKRKSMDVLKELVDEESFMSLLEASKWAQDGKEGYMKQLLSFLGGSIKQQWMK